MIEQHINAVEKPHKRENINRKKIKDGLIALFMTTNYIDKLLTCKQH